MYLTSLLLCLMLFVACPEQSGKAKQLSLGQPFTLKMGQEARFKDERVKIRFISVAEDSRCPQGVNCIWAGNAKVSMVLEKASSKPVIVELNTLSEPRVGNVMDYQITLTDLSPYPQANKTINRKDYTATIVLSHK